MDEEERWEGAFHVLKLRKDFFPQEPEADYQISLKELATLSNQQLLQRLKSGNGPPKSEAEYLSIIDYFRKNPLALN